VLASIDQTEARNVLPGSFDANSTLAKSRPIAPPQSEDAVDTGADHLQEGVLAPFQVTGPWKASANTSVSVMRRSDWLTGSNLESLVRWPGDGSG
jgi:hypothetical protein